MLAGALLTAVRSSMPVYYVVKKWLDLIINISQSYTLIIYTSKMVMSKNISIHFPSFSRNLSPNASDFCGHRRAEGRACGVVQLAMKMNMVGAMWQSRYTRSGSIWSIFCSQVCHFPVL